MSDPTRFDLDDRQRAMLAEMGVRVWWPQRTQAPTPDPAGDARATPESLASPAALLKQPLPQADTATEAPTRPEHRVPATAAAASEIRSGPASAARPAAAKPLPAVPPAVPTEAVLARQALPEGVAQMDGPALQQAVSTCGACALCSARRAPILGTGHGQAPWMVVGDLPSEEDDQSGQPFTGDEGLLLDNMLKAVGARRSNGVSQQGGAADLAEAYLTHAVKCRPPGGRNPEAAELTTCSGYLSRQVALVQPKVILAMGRFAVQSLLGSTEPTGRLRGRLHDFQGVPVVVTYAPASLLRSPADKAKAWADLVLALQVVQA